jgi:mediator of replication checkpoint protein 1
LRKSGDLNELSLTLDVRLQPALEVNEKLRRQADSVFEKEQEYLLEAARRVPKQKQELYVNDHGYDQFDMLLFYLN